MEIIKKKYSIMCVLPKKLFNIHTFTHSWCAQSHSCARAHTRAHTSMRAHDTSVKLKFLPLLKQWSGTVPPRQTHKNKQTKS